MSEDPAFAASPVGALLQPKKAIEAMTKEERDAYEALFVRDDGLLTEGSFTNLFVERDGKLLTPRASLGLLPGVLRRRLLDEGRAEEAELTLDDLAGGFLVGNAVRGLIRARLQA